MGNWKGFDPRPKRRKSADNPYTLQTMGIDTPTPRYYLSFRDSSGETQELELPQTLFEAFDQFEREDLSFLNEVDRHYEHSEQTEGTLNKRAVRVPESVEETVSRRLESEALHKAINRLPEKQRRRVLCYYFEELTYAQIAQREGCAVQVIARSVKAAEKSLKNWMTEG